ncbi:glycosyltransferase family protein [Phyllobacterium myrsinacearum]|uniref:Putative glycosyltransferase n=1 Tax=Phyllobacterium myrsinacearum TaxID=28101 RepID=A0A839EIF1_9HYPH|nr:glycosyltransferase [Phyllobacterium myrsinacearum]MBA8879771.1 putative glycosyltransferase [Phyllobacterium myrsinacearum]
MTAPRVFFYVQHLLGIGHLARASRIASALAADGFDVTVVTGGLAVPGFPGPDVKSVALPAVVANNAGFSGLADERGNPVDEGFLHHRRDLLLQAFHAARPDIVIVEAFPFGRRQMRFELLPLLDAIATASPRPKLLTSVRDILQERTKPGRDAETVALIKAHFDHVLVHGDPDFVTLPETFPLAADIADKIIYTGLVAAPVPAPPADAFEIVVSAGGGAVGLDLVRSAVEAARTSRFAGRWCLITGPNLPDEDFAALSDQTPDNVTLVRFRKDFPSLLAGAELSISQAGYNTVCDVLRVQCRSILVPFTAGGETEQTVRATRLEELGLAVALPESGLNAEILGEAVDRVLSRPKPGHHTLDLNGAHRTAEILRDLL